MKQRLFNIAAGLSLLLFAASAALWIRSRYAADLVGYGSGPTGNCEFYGLLSSMGDLAIYYREPAADNARGLLIRMDLDRGWRLTESRFWTFHLDYGRLNLGALAVVVPIWSAILLFAAIPSVWLYARFKQCKETTRCRTCGYDLRATPARCPECGAVPAVK